MPLCLKIYIKNQKCDKKVTSSDANVVIPHSFRRQRFIEDVTTMLIKHLSH